MRIGIAVVVAIFAVACSKKDEPPAAKAKAAPSAPAPTEAPKPSAGHPADSFVPESILSRLGDSKIVFAVDFTKLRTTRFNTLIPDVLGCVRDMADAAGIAVLGADARLAVMGFITKIPQSLTNTCLGSLGINPVASGDGSDQFDLGGRQISVAWRDDVAVIHETGKEVTGTLSKQIRDTIARMPPTAIGWLIVDDFDNWKTQGAQRATLSFDASETAFMLSGTVDGTRPGSARQFVTETLDAVKAGLGDAGMVVQDRWFKISSTEMSAAFEMKMPLSALPAP